MDLLEEGSVKLIACLIILLLLAGFTENDDVFFEKPITKDISLMAYISYDNDPGYFVTWLTEYKAQVGIQIKF